MKFLTELLSDTSEQSHHNAMVQITKASKSDAFTMRDMEPENDNKSIIQTTIDELNKLITSLGFDDTNPENQSLLSQATLLRDQLKQELNSQLPKDTEMSSISNHGAGSSPGMFNRTG